MSDFEHVELSACEEDILSSPLDTLILSANIGWVETVNLEVIIVSILSHGNE